MQTRTSFPASAESIPAARQFVVDALNQWGLARLDEPARLGVSELVTNALVHGRGEIEITVRAEGRRLRVEVADSDPTVPVRRPRSLDDLGGRGLVLVDDLAAAWGVDQGESGKAVWFELDVDGTAGNTGPGNTGPGNGMRRSAAG